jgi:hypothetical protein
MSDLPGLRKRREQRAFASGPGGNLAFGGKTSRERDRSPVV